MSLIGARLVDRGNGAKRLFVVLEYLGGRVARHPVSSVREGEDMILTVAQEQRWRG